jgi:hypothetical protein
MYMYRIVDGIILNNYNGLQDSVDRYDDCRPLWYRPL